MIADLSHGLPQLAGRRFDFLLDKVRVLHLLGEREAVISTWRLLGTVAWVPASMVARGDAALLATLGDTRLSEVTARAKVASWLATPNAATLTAHPLSREERLVALSTVWSTAREYFVWFDKVPDLDWDRAYLDAIPRVMDAPDEPAFWRELMRFTALLRDGHSSVSPPEAVARQFWARPGLRTAWIEDRVLVTEVFDRMLLDRIHVGDEVVALDGEPVRDFAARHVTPYQSSSTPQDLDVRRYGYGLLAGPPDQPLKIELLGADGRREIAIAPRSGYEATPAAPRQSFELRSDGIAVLRAGQFESDAAHAMLALNEESLFRAKGLVVDLRGNGGGNSDHGMAVLRWLSHVPLPTTRSQVRNNDLQIKRAPILLWRPVAEEPSAAVRSKVFTGHAVLLVDARTFSAAEDTAAVFKLMRRGTIIGSPTGGSTGQALVMPLPGGGMVSICVKRDSYPDGSDFVGSGVQPDIFVDTGVADIRRRRDPVMARALRHLTGSP